MYDDLTEDEYLELTPERQTTYIYCTSCQKYIHQSKRNSDCPNYTKIKENFKNE